MQGMEVRDVSKTRRAVQAVFAVLFSFCCAGIIFGFAALKPVLIREGIYRNLCEESDPAGDVCKSQDSKLNFIFTVGTTVTNAAALPIGAFLDHFGPFYTSLFGSIMFGMGNLLLGLASPTQTVDYPLIAFVFLALGGPLIFLPCFHLSNAFPGHEGFILSAVTGAFDASSLPWVVLSELNERSVVGLRGWFWGYIVIPVVIIVQQLVMGPRTPYLNAPVSNDCSPAPERQNRILGASAYTPNFPDSALESSEQTPLLEGTSAFSKVSLPRRLSFPRRFSDVSYFRPPVDGAHDLMEDEEDVRGVLWGRTARQQISTSWFLAIACFLTVHMVRINFYIQTCHRQLLVYTQDEDLATQITKAFTYLLPLGGVLGVPFIGYLLDHTRTISVIYVLGLSGLALGILTMTSQVWTQLLGIGIFALFRPLMYTFVSDYSSKVFGFETFGTVYGLANTIAGLLGLSQASLDQAVKYRFDGNYDSVNTGLLILGSLSAALLAWRVNSRRDDDRISLDRPL
ncbi:MFS general substrate transporter [Atractiella rhizophila]|nr:MFS general substrate transporter [Atractiella rhizophila]